MLIKEALILAAAELDVFSSKQLESRILLAHVLNLSQEALLINCNEEITTDTKLKFFDCIKRRQLFEPIAYIIGKKEFYGIDFIVNPHVLIPRADTEILVDTIISAYLMEYHDKNIRILDLGTGSGAISVSLAANISRAKIIATDISSHAFAVAAANAKIHNVDSQIVFTNSNWYSNLKRNSNKFDFIVSNPPYVSAADQSFMSKETLLHEPKHSLFAEHDGLINYEKIISGASNFLQSNGKIFLEIGFNQAAQVAKILEQYQFTEIIVLKDLAEHDRAIVASRARLM